MPMLPATFGHLPLFLICPSSAPSQMLGACLAVQVMGAFGSVPIFVYIGEEAEQRVALTLVFGVQVTTDMIDGKAKITVANSYPSKDFEKLS